MLAACLLLLADPTPVVVAVGPLSAPAPAGWQSEKPANRLRSHQFKLEAKAGGPPAEVVVYPESSPKWEQKFDEWKATVTPAGGGSAKVTEQPLPGGAVAHRLDAAGTWRYRERPRDPKSKEELREGYRVVWLVVTHDGGATHVRFSGPAAAVAEHLAGFDAWVAGLK